MLNRNFELYLSAFSLEKRNITSPMRSKEDGPFPIGNLDGKTFPAGKIRGSPLERRNVSLREVENFPGFPEGRKKKTFPSGKGKHFPREKTRLESKVFSLEKLCLSLFSLVLSP